MSSPELARMGKLRQVLRLSAHGKGIAASIVETFGESGIEEEREMVRHILLGNPVEQSVANLLSRNDPSRDILLYVVNQAKVDAVEASKRADKLTSLFEHWVWMKKQRIVEQRIMETRSIMVSTILGGVTAMISALAPVLASFQLSLTAAPPPAPMPSYLGILFVLPAASFLGIFFSPKRAYLNVIVATGAYLMVTYFFAPLVVTI
ncbi:MAG: ATP-dependent Clp protease proteolytic subunit [Thaumarchaeota archaeon]|nr:ATP-dependent Clp protease proteolytic subunit [Nitrososphaerota archaeon]